MDPIFPLPIPPTQSFEPSAGAANGLSFGVPRHGGPRIHAGCDLCVPCGTPVMAVDNGVVHYPPFLFYGPEHPHIWVIAIWHPKLNEGKGLLVRYGEIEQIPRRLFRKGESVNQCDFLGRVSNQGKNSMLHVEIYRTNTPGDLTVRSNFRYENFGKIQFERRGDLIDPTPILKQWQSNMVGFQTIVERRTKQKP